MRLLWNCSFLVLLLMVMRAVAADGPVAKTEFGPVQGKTSGNGQINIFLGMPFAAPSGWHVALEAAATALAVERASFNVRQSSLAPEPEKAVSGGPKSWMQHDPNAVAFLCGTGKTE